MFNTESFLRKLAEHTESCPDIVPSVHLWIRQEPRFVNFLEAHESKILRKFRDASTPEDQLDVAAELEVAYLLIDSQTALVYEPTLKGRLRAPDLLEEYFRNLGWVCGLQRKC